MTNDRTAFQICTEGPSGDHEAAAIASGDDHAALAHLADGLGVAADDFRHLVDGIAAVLIKADRLRRARRNFFFFHFTSVEGYGSIIIAL